LLNLVSRLTKNLEKTKNFLRRRWNRTTTVEAGEIGVRRTDAPERAPAKLIKSVKQTSAKIRIPIF
jgi:hypothetical protein